MEDELKEVIVTCNKCGNRTGIGLNSVVFSKIFEEGISPESLKDELSFNARILLSHHICPECLENMNDSEVNMLFEDSDDIDPTDDIDDDEYDEYDDDDDDDDDEYDEDGYSEYDDESDGW